MAEKIKTISFVHIGDELVSTDELSQEQKVELATSLKASYLNELFRGKATFRAAEG